MIEDIRYLSPGASLDADMCIIGGGAAGIAIAREFLGSGYKVILLEGGGFRPEGASQDLYRGACTGEPYYKGLAECRTRCFGGSTNCWGGICTPLNRVDFEQRSWVPLSGWPVRYDDVIPYYMRAHSLCSKGPFAYGLEAWQVAGIPACRFDPRLFDQFVWQFNNRFDVELNFGSKFRRDIQQANNIEVYLHANAIELEASEAGDHVDRVRLRTLAGQTNYVRARAFVLACGGIENARLLLASDSTHPNGLGNDRDLVGRFFHEHLQAPCGVLVDSSGQSNTGEYSRLFRLGATWCTPGFGLARDAQAAGGVLNGCIAIEPFYDREGALLAFHKIRSDFRARRLGAETLRCLIKVARESAKLAPQAWQRFVHGARPDGDPHRFVLYARAEQAPNPQSRVLLSHETDELGMRRANLDWRTMPQDHTTIPLMASFAAQEFKRLGVGEVILPDWLGTGEWPLDLAGGPHHMGTTRMADDPRFGVVDANCQVYGIDDLYVAGSSIFPTGGHANPTLSILAFAIRLSEHLKVVLSRDSTLVAGPDLQCEQAATGA